VRCNEAAADQMEHTARAVSCEFGTTYIHNAQNIYNQLQLLISVQNVWPVHAPSSLLCVVTVLQCSDQVSVV
jgi:hypothetical protein